jgi:hypothetical protein
MILSFMLLLLVVVVILVLLFGDFLRGMAAVGDGVIAIFFRLFGACAIVIVDVDVHFVSSRRKVDGLEVRDVITQYCFETK